MGLLEETPPAFLVEHRFSYIFITPKFQEELK
jgi:hypothetical protein